MVKANSSNLGVYVASHGPLGPPVLRDIVTLPTCCRETSHNVYVTTGVCQRDRRRLVRHTRHPHHDNTRVNIAPGLQT